MLDEKDELPKYPYNVKPKNIEVGTLIFATVRKVDSFGLAISCPGGHSGFVKTPNISKKVSQDYEEEGLSFNLKNMYKVGDSVLGSVKGAKSLYLFINFTLI